MIFTSYFANIKNFPPNVIPISICAKVPDWYTGLRYSKLAPKYDLLMKYKVDHNKANYIECYNNTTLKCLNPLWVLNDLQCMIDYELGDSQYPFWEIPDLHVALICYEKPTDFCHRHLVAEWFRNYGVECDEWQKNKVT